MNSPNVTWVLHIEKSGDDLVLVMPDYLLAALGVKEGDTLQWIPLPGRKWEVRKA